MLNSSPRRMSVAGFLPSADMKQRRMSITATPMMESPRSSSPRRSSVQKPNILAADTMKNVASLIPNAINEVITQTEEEEDSELLQRASVAAKDLIRRTSKVSHDIQRQVNARKRHKPRPIEFLSAKAKYLVEAGNQYITGRRPKDVASMNAAAAEKAVKGGDSILFFLNPEGTIMCERGLQTKDEDLLHFAELKEICNEFIKEVELSSKFMEKSQTQHLTREAMDLYEKMAHKVNMLISIQESQLSWIREQCAGQLEEDTYYLIENLEEFNTMAMEKFEEKIKEELVGPTSLLDTQKEKLHKLQNDLTRQKYIATRLIHILKVNEILEDSTPAEDRLKNANVVEEYQSKVQDLENQVTELRKHQDHLEEHFEALLKLKPDLVSAFNHLSEEFGNIIHIPHTVSPSPRLSAKPDSPQSFHGYSPSAHSPGAFSSTNVALLETGPIINFESLIFLIKKQVEEWSNKGQAQHLPVISHHPHRHRASTISDTSDEHNTPRKSVAAQGTRMRRQSNAAARKSIAGRPSVVAAVKESPVNEILEENEDETEMDLHARHPHKAPHRSHRRASIHPESRRVSQAVMDMTSTEEEEEENEKEKEKLDKLKADIDKKYESIKNEIKKQHDAQLLELVKERLRVKAIWKMKFQTLKKLRRLSRVEKVMERQEGLLNVVTQITMKSTAEAEVQCELKGRTYREALAHILDVQAMLQEGITKQDSTAEINEIGTPISTSDTTLESPPRVESTSRPDTQEDSLLLSQVESPFRAQPIVDTEETEEPIEESVPSAPIKVPPGTADALLNQTDVRPWSDHHTPLSKPTKKTTVPSLLRKKK